MYLHLRYSFTHQLPPNNSSRHCGWCEKSPIGFQWHSNSTYPIWRQRKDDPNNASGSASGYRANTHTQEHTRVHTICVFPSLEEPRSRHMCLPELLLRKGSERDSILVGENTVNSDFIKQHFHLLCLCLILCISTFYSFLFISVFSSVSDQVVGPPAAGAFRERPSKPTTFRKFYERGEFPMALEHDAKGNRIAWKVETLPTRN